MKHIRSRWIGWALVGAVAVLVIVGITPHHTTLAQSGGTLGYGSKVYGNVGPNAPLVTYAFPGSPGDWVSITADTWTGTLDIQLELVAPNGVVLGSSRQNTLGGDPMSAYLSVFLPDAGLYLLRLSGENGTTGDYLLTLFGRAVPVSTPLVYGQPVDVTIPQNAPSQYFTFDAEACPTTLIVDDLSEGQPFGFPYVVKVRDQRGQTVALLRGGEQREDWVTVEAESGRYEVEVMAADPALAGAIRLLVTCSGGAPGCTAGQAAITGPPATCVPCPRPDQPVPGGGCPDLHLAAQQSPFAANVVTVTWDAMPGAEGYTVFVRGLITGGGEVYLTHADWVPGDPLQFTWILPTEGYIGFTFTLEVLAGGEVICTQETGVKLELPPSQTLIPCAIRTDRWDVEVRVGPGPLRSVFTYLPTAQDIPVIGQALDDEGNRWWQIDKSVIPGSDAVISLWVAESDVIPVGDCSQVPEGDIPPLIPGDQWEPPGMWLPCGSCDTCGHPANECVTSPEGLCLWDPATCAPPPLTGECYTINVTIDMGRCYGPGSAMLDTVSNCGDGSSVPGISGQFSPGTVINAHAVAVDPKCIVDYWSGCGTSGSGANISFTATSSCTLTAHMRY